MSDFNYDYITEKPWNFKNMEILPIVKKSREKFGTLSDYPGLSIKDGVQVLWKKKYHITKFTIKNGMIIGQNGFGEDVHIELESCKPMVYNKVFSCFKDLKPNAYCIFPYEGAELKDKIKFTDFCTRYPNAGKYLSDNRELIIDNVATIKDEELWHTFTREHNHKTFNENKIIIPMTAKDTIATVVFNNGLYMDNSNVWFITVTDGDNKLLRAIAAIINSTTFSALAKSEANPQLGCYYKFNKQFLKPVPFPIANFRNNKGIIEKLNDLSIKISENQKEYINALPYAKDSIRSSLENYWQKVDDISMNLYELTDEQKQIVVKYGRSESRVDLLK